MKLKSLPLLILLCSCGSKVEEIKNPLNGQLELRYEYYLDSDGQKIKDGEYIEWYPDGSKRLIQNYTDGILQGEAIFFKNKDTIAYNNYLNGELHGFCQMKNDKGVTIAKLNYENGLLSGKQEYFYRDGTKKCVGNFSIGLADGKWTYFSTKGEKVGAFNLELGVPKELSGTWHVDGRRNVYYTFDEEGSFSFNAPLFKYSQEASEIMIGQTMVGQNITFLFNNGIVYESLEIESINSSKITVVDKDNKTITWEKLVD